MRLKLISCEVLYREMCAAVARSPHQVDIGFMPKGLHDGGSAEMRQRIQAAVDLVEAAEYDAVLLGYGLCGNGLAGLQARSRPVILPRAHDCITLFLGSRQRYSDYFQKHPGVYFKTTGWIERGDRSGELTQVTMRKIGCGLSRGELEAKYGSENAEYLDGELNHYQQQYRQFTFIEMGMEPDDSFERCTLEEANHRGWRFEKVRGDMSLIDGLMSGHWPDRDYLVVRPGYRIVARYDEGIIDTERVE